MITRSVVSSLHGEPRSTHDIDLLVCLEESDVKTILSLFPSPDFYVSESTIRDAIRRESKFNVVSLAGGDKLDFWILTNEPFDRSRFARRKTMQVFIRTVVYNETKLRTRGYLTKLLTQPGRSGR